MGNATYNVYCDGKLVDKELTRNYGSYYRVDIVGITAGEHTVKIVPVFDGTEQQTPATTFTKTLLRTYARALHLWVVKQLVHTTWMAR